MKTLKNIQTLSKIGKVLSNIAFIVSIIAACLCIAGTLCLNLGADNILDNIAFSELIGISSEDTLAVANAALIGGILICIGEAVLAKFAAVYFKHELSAETPFTHKGARELKRLGILAIVIPVVCSAATYFVAEFVFGFMDKLTSTIDITFNCESSISLGIMFIIMSLLCRHGAELAEGKNEKDTSTEL